MSECRIHRGEMNMYTFLPVDKNGKHIHYGYRLCNNPECINREHITTSIRVARAKGLRPKPLFHLRNDITGEELAKYAKRMPRGEKRLTICNVPHCHRPVRSLSLCDGHHIKYTRWRKENGIVAKRMSLDYTPLLEIALPFVGVNDFRPKDRYCHVDNCEREYRARGFCKKHHNQYLRALKQREIANGSNGQTAKTN